MVVEDARGWEHIGNPLKLSDEPPDPQFSTAAHGEHSIEILEGLGYGKTEIEGMLSEGTVIGKSQ